MDLDIKGRKAIVCASSKGLGRACAFALARAGVDVVVNGRDAARAEATAQEIRDATGVKVVVIAGDLGVESVRAAVPSPTFSSTTTAALRPRRSRRSHAKSCSTGWKPIC
jgi:short-subunit dehydrogenase